MRFMPVGLVLLAVLCVILAALLPVSRAKGWTRLLGSMFVGAGVGTALLSQPTSDNRVWPRVFGIVAGPLLMWAGLRKHRRDPEGRTPAASIL